MKKFLIVLCAVMMLFSSSVFKNVRSVSAETVQYERSDTDFSKGLPSDWSLYRKSDTSNVIAPAVSTYNGKNVLSLGHDTLSTVKAESTNYQGVVYEVAKGEGNLTDFTVEMRFKITASASDGYVGLGYHMVSDASTKNYYSGYMAGFTLGGKTFASAIVKNTYLEYANGANADVPSYDKQTYHTLKVEVSGTDVKQYIDDREMLSYRYTDFDGRTHDSYFAEGKFVLIFHLCSANIYRFKITDGVKGNAVAEIRPHVGKTPLSSTPAVAQDVVDETGFSSLGALPKLSTAILHVDANCNVVSKNGSVLSSFESVYAQYKDNLLFAVYPVSQIAGEAFVQKAKQNGYKDMAVVSDDLSLLASMRKELPAFRGYAWLVDEKIDTVEKRLEIIHQTTLAKATVAIISETYASKETVEYIQERAKTVWVYTKNESRLDTVSAIASGAFGFVSSSGSEIISEFSSFETNYFPMLYTPLNIAHRGYAYGEYGENTLSACIAAYENGATHVEIDMCITQDGIPVISHDANIQRLTGQNKVISQITYEELCKYPVLVNSLGQSVEPEKMASLEEIFSYFEDKDIIIVLEIKDGGERVKDELTRLFSTYDVLDQTFFICFGNIELVQSVAPSLPSLWLQKSGDEQTYLTTYNHGVDYSMIGDYSPSEKQGYIARGYMLFGWTYDNSKAFDTAMKQGVYGITNNVAQDMSGYTRNIEPVTVDGGYIKVSSLDNLETLTGLKVKEIDYKNQTKSTGQASVAFFEKHDGYADVILKYPCFTANGFCYTLFTQKVRLVDSARYVKASVLQSLTEKTKDDFKTDATRSALEKGYNAYSLLLDSDKATISYDKLSLLYESVMNSSEEPSEEISEEPSEEISEELSKEISEELSETVSQEPSEEQSQEPSEEPSEEQSQEPSENPSEPPSENPSEGPSEKADKVGGGGGCFGSVGADAIWIFLPLLGLFKRKKKD